MSDKKRAFEDLIVALLRRDPLNCGRSEANLCVAASMTVDAVLEGVLFPMKVLDDALHSWPVPKKPTVVPTPSPAPAKAS